MADHTICPHFLRGRCKFGDRCKFEHTRHPPAHGGYASGKRQSFDMIWWQHGVQLVAPLAHDVLALVVDQRRQICSYFMNGRCKFGDRCKYEHPSSVAQNRLHVGKTAHTHEIPSVSTVCVNVTSFLTTVAYSTFTGFGRSQKHQGDPYSWRRQSEPPSVRDACAGQHANRQLRG